MSAPRLTLELGEFAFHRPKVRARTGGLYHPILHMHPTDMRHLNLTCGGLASVIASVASERGRSPQKGKAPMTVAAVTPNGHAVVAIAWPQAGCPQGQARLSRLLRRCLVHGRPFEYDDGLSHVTVGPVGATSGTANNAGNFNASPPPPAAATIEVAMLESTREQLTRGRGRNGVDFPGHLESYIAHALMGRIVSIGTGFSCPVLGVAHTFWISGIIMKPGAFSTTATTTATTASTLTTASPATAAAYADPFVRVAPDTTIRILRRSVKENAAEMSPDHENEAAPGQNQTPHDSITRTGTKDSAYSSIGGLDTQLKTIRSMIELPLHSPAVFTGVGLQPPKGVLMYGPPGTGKTMIARAVAKSCDATFLSINGAELLSNVVGESELALRQVFDRALRAQPALIFIDEIDALCPRRDRSAEDIDKRMVSTLLTLMDGVDSGTQSGAGREGAVQATQAQMVRDNVSAAKSLTPAPPRIVVLAATNRPDALDPAVRRPGRFDREVEVGIPTELGREEILSKMLAPLPHVLSCADIHSVAAKAHGFVGADLRALCQEAGMASLRRSLQLQANSTGSVATETAAAANITLADLYLALGRITPSAMREVAVEVPSVRWSDIGGQEDVKQRLREAVEWPLQRPEVFEMMGIRPPKGVLLYGPPGCSKTLMAKAVATESGMNFIAVKGPELFNKWVGESERAVAEIFRKARAASPAVVFFDEIDALASQRGGDGDSGGVADRVLSQLLTELDGVRPLKQVVVLAATNRPDLIDAALTRPGRIDRRLYVSPPDAAARAEILKIHTKDTPLALDVDLSAVAAQCAGLSGAEIAAVCREAALHAIEEDGDAQEVWKRHFLRAVGDVEPQITSAMLAFFESFG